MECGSHPFVRTRFPVLSHKKIQGAVAALSAVVLLAACTPSGSNPDTTRDDAKKSAEAAADPVFRVGTITDAAADDSASSKTGAASTEPAAPTGSAAPTSTTAPAPEQAGEVVDSGSDITVDPGQRLSLNVDGAVLSDISISDVDHPRISTDPGQFFDTSGSQLDAVKADDAANEKSGNSESTEEPTQSEGPTDESTKESTDGATEDPQDEKSKQEKADTVTAPDDAAAWVSTYDLTGDSTYDLTATATSADGQEHDFTATVTTNTSSDASPMSVRTTLSDDQTVGVGAPIIFSFGSTVAKQYRDDVEHRLSVKVTDKDGKKRKVEGSWAWLPDDPQSRLHFRPKDFWPAHSKVSVDAPLKNVPTTDKTVGQNDLTLDFEIGRKQVVKADAKSHRMTVTRDGKQTMNFPASLGAPKSPSYNGTHVVMSKSADYTMKSQKWDYETDVKWAVRIHNNGEFIHAAPWSTGVQGSANVSHGCINLSTARAKQYYDTAIFGDPVEITGSDVNLSTEDSDISDWVYDWSDWKKMSALD